MSFSTSTQICSVFDADPTVLFRVPNSIASMQSLLVEALDVN